MSTETCNCKTHRPGMLERLLEDDEFKREFCKADLIMAITEAVCKVLESYGFKQEETAE